MKKRSITLKGHRTSVTLEAEFWTALESIATARKTSIQKLVETIDASRGDNNLSSALRVFILRNKA
ncbi:MAG TPA: ribbon-helix-helix domain-containing protein [Alphaproteobacteria bacterium]